MDGSVIGSLKRALSNGFETLPKGIGKHRAFSYAGDDYLVRTLAADPATITTLMRLDRTDHHLPEIIVLTDQAYEVQPYLPFPTLTDAPIHTLDQTRTAYTHIWNAIGACHEVGIGHGDVHPDNIIYRDGRITIIDWERAGGRDRPSTIPRFDRAHYDYAGLTYTGRGLFMNHPEIAGIFPETLCSLRSAEALERTVRTISEGLNLPRLA